MKLVHSVINRIYLIHITAVFRPVCFAIAKKWLRGFAADKKGKAERRFFPALPPAAYAYSLSHAIIISQISTSFSKISMTFSMVLPPFCICFLAGVVGKSLCPVTPAGISACLPGHTGIGKPDSRTKNRHSCCGIFYHIRYLYPSIYFYHHFQEIATTIGKCSKNVLIFSKSITQSSPVNGIEQESTCAAFVAARNRSYFGIETDVYVTAAVFYIIFIMLQKTVATIYAAYRKRKGQLHAAQIENRKIKNEGYHTRSKSKKLLCATVPRISAKY